jgi:seryl-tRNA synthetase
MHDLRAIRDNPEDFDRGLARRGLPPCAGKILDLDQQWRAAETKVQEGQAERNRLGKKIGAAKKRGETELRQDIREAMMQLQERDLAAESADPNRRSTAAIQFSGAAA